jgi:hypothetical protein
MSLHARPGGTVNADDAIRNPVFPEMEDKLREFTRGH